MTLEGNVPKICYDDRFVPICGRHYWDNNFGARLFCKMLGRCGGTVSKTKIDLVEDAYHVGKCSSTDTDINTCSGGNNERKLGEDDCEKGKESVVHISCGIEIGNGELFLITYNLLKSPYLDKLS